MMQKQIFQFKYEEHFVSDRCFLGKRNNRLRFTCTQSLYHRKTLFTICLTSLYPFKRQPHKMVKKFVGYCVQIVWVCLTILQVWRLKDHDTSNSYQNLCWPISRQFSISIPPENIKNLWFSDVFRGRGYKNGALAWNGKRELQETFIFFLGGPNWHKIFCKRLEINRPEQSFVPEELANFLTYFVLVTIFISIFSQQNTGKYWNKKVFSYKMGLMELSLNLRGSVRIRSSSYSECGKMRTRIT